MKNSKPFFIVQIILMYLTQMFFFAFLGINENEGLQNICGILFLILLIILCLFCIANIIISFIRFGFESKEPFKITLVSKIILIPWYVLNFIICVALIGGFLNPFLLLGIPILILLEISVTYLCMFSTSMPNIIYALRAYVYDHRKIKFSNLLTIILHFIFCLDLLGAILFKINFNRLFIGETEGVIND